MTEHLPSNIAEAGAWLRSGRITSVGLTEELLARSRAAQDTIAAFIAITDDAALAAARRADAELADGHDRGPLHGVPLGIKDILATVDAPTTANSRVLDPNWGQRARRDRGRQAARGWRRPARQTRAARVRDWLAGP